MSALLNCGGDDDFCLASNSMEFGLQFSINPRMGVCCPPRKRARICAPFFFNREEPEAKKPSIECLPDECMFEILRRLAGGRERRSSACVSKRWLSLLSNMRRSEVHCLTEMAEGSEGEELHPDGCLTRCLEGKKATDLRLAAISVGTSCHGGLGKLSIRGSNLARGVTGVGLTSIARAFPSLRAFSLWNVPSVGDEGLIEVARECRMLQKLDLCECPSITDRGLVAIAENCPELTSLNVESCFRIGNASLQAIGGFCPKLQSVSIKGCPLVGDLGVGCLLSSSSLSKVKLQDLSITDVSLAVMGQCGRFLTGVALSGLQSVTEKGFWVMANARGLKMATSLSFTSCRGITDLSLEAMGRGCPNLRHMELRKCCIVSDGGLAAFARAATSLKSLQLEECNRITQAGVVAVLSNVGYSKLRSLALVKCMGIKDLNSNSDLLVPSPFCSSLRSLTIKNCTGFGGASLSMVGRYCPRLQNLDLSGLAGVTDAGLLPLLESCCEGLVKVNLSGCANLTDELVLAMAVRHGGTLQLLNLDGCRRISDASLVAIAGRCPLLNDLDVSRCAVTDSGVAALSGGDLFSLQVLSLSGCSRVSSKSEPYLMKLGETLMGLNLRHCNSINSGTVEQLVERLWRCDILV